MASLNDVARLAGVSKSTASRVLNNKGYLSADTRERVYSAMKQLNYRPEDAAISRLSGRFGTVGLLVPDVCYPHFAALAFCIEAELCRRGYRMLLCNTKNSEELGVDSLEAFKHGAVDGLILCNRAVTDEELAALGRPVVSVDKYANPKISTVSSDHPSSGEAAARRLISAGCTHVLQTVGTGSKGSPWNERHAVFERTLMENGVKCYTHFRDTLKISDIEFNRAALREQFALHPEIDGYFGNDLSCIAAIEAARALGRKIPDDLCVIACDGTLLTQVYTPRITSIRQPTEKIAQWAVETVCKLIDDPELSVCDVQLRSSIVEGDTTR